MTEALPGQIGVRARTILRAGITFVAKRAHSSNRYVTSRAPFDGLGSVGCSEADHAGSSSHSLVPGVSMVNGAYHCCRGPL